MTIYSLPVGAAKLATLGILVLLSTASLTWANDAPDSVDAIQAALPDSISLNDKVVYVDFWASWCAPCRHSFPVIQNWYSRYHEQGFEVIAVSVDKDHASALKFLDDNNVSFPIVFDSTGALAKQYGLEAMPTSFIYGRDGHLVSEHWGFRPEEIDSLNSAILHLLNKEDSE